MSAKLSGTIKRRTNNLWINNSWMGMFKAIEIDEIHLKSINDKFTKTKTGKFTLTAKYRIFKQILDFKVKRPPKIIKPPYKIIIYQKTYLDIDNAIKPIIDSLKNRVIIDDNDVEALHVYKEKRKRGAASSLVVYVDSLSDH